MISRFLAGVALAVLCVLLAFSYPVVAAQAVNSTVIRIHVLAHDNSQREQDIKLSVRDTVLTAIGKLVSEAGDSEEAQRLIAAHLPQIKHVAEEHLVQLGSDHGINLQWGKFVFPSRVYKETALPAGRYQALNIVIGGGQGKNWWCIMYPPLCYVDGVVQNGQEVSYQFAIVNLLKGIWKKITD